MIIDMNIIRKKLNMIYLIKKSDISRIIENVMPTPYKIHVVIGRDIDNVNRNKLIWSDM